MNQPMNTSHNPLMKFLVVRARNTPNPMIPNPSTEPVMEAKVLALLTLPVIFHTIDLSTLPPSRGNAGIRLNIASATLINARYWKIASTGELFPATITKRPQKIMPSARLASGPTNAIQNSSPA